MNDTDYFLSNLMMGMVSGHDATQTAILIITPLNNTKYTCTNGSALSVPYHIFVAGEC